VRFRHKLSIVLVVLAVVPLVAAGGVGQWLLARDEVRSVDARLSSGAAAGAATYRSQLVLGQTLAAQLAGRPDVAQAFARRRGSASLLAGVPGGFAVALADDRGVFAGSLPDGAVWRSTATLVPSRHDRRVIVSLPLDRALLLRIVQQSPVPEGVDLALAVSGRIVADQSGGGGSVKGFHSGGAVGTRVDGTAVRAQAMSVQGPDGAPALMVAEYPQSRIDDRINSLRLTILLVVLVFTAAVAVFAVFAANGISRALDQLSRRAATLVQSGAPPPPTGGDELDQLNTALDTMSDRLTARMGELETERARLKTTLARYGETLAATHDLRALLGAVLETALQVTRARGGRLLLYNPQRGEATEQVRLGTARGSRADLPMVVPAGRGLEGETLRSQQPRSATTPRAVLAVPIMREQSLLGVVTVVDPEDGAFEPGDVETLAGLAVQAGVAIENARLHRAVERQAITDDLTGLANRRQFYEALGREFERAHRFGTPLSLILLDVDDFKRINDAHPMKHLAGDAVLRAVADAVAGHTRDIDLAARYGGEEFAVLLPQTDHEGAINLAERLRLAVAEREVEFAGAPTVSVTASFGVASGPIDDRTQLDLIAAADNALYQSKREGKNRVT
jgi:diguanylate cyclase (GGDEF)-like protein